MNPTAPSITETMPLIPGPHDQRSDGAFTNVERAERFRSQMLHYASDLDDPPAAVTDILADAMHFCRMAGIDFWHAIDRATRAHDDEKDGAF